MQLVPCATGLYFLNTYIAHIASNYPQTSLTYDAALLSVDLQGLTDRLVAHATWKVRDYTEGKGLNYIYEFILNEDIPPDRITYNGTVPINIKVPEFLYDTVKSIIDSTL